MQISFCGKVVLYRGFTNLKSKDRRGTTPNEEKTKSIRIDYIGGESEIPGTHERPCTEAILSLAAVHVKISRRNYA